MKLFALALWAFSSIASAAVALVRADYIAMGLSGAAMATSTSVAVYVYLTVARDRKTARRVGEAEAGAADITRRLRPGP